MFTKVLVPLDRSPLAEQAISYAAEIARACGASLDVVLVHEPDEFALVGDQPMWIASQRAAEDAYVTRVVGDIARDFSVNTTGAALNGPVVEAIAKRAREVSADLVVITSHGRTGLSRAWLGSVADGIIRHVGIPVLMLRPTSLEPTVAVPLPVFRRIVVPLDGSAESQRILDAAVVVARCGNASITLMRVVQPVPLITPQADVSMLYPAFVVDDVATAQLAHDARQHLAGIARTLEEKGIAGIETEVLVEDGVARAVVNFATTHGADLVAMSTHGRGASRLLIGSVADKILRASTLPMLLLGPVHVGAVKAPDDASRAPGVPLMHVA